jgi:hypothetical protein
MNRSSGFRNKLVYLLILITMLMPLYLLGQPSGGSTGDAGGQLTQMRTKFNIAESELGDINPASETMKLASLGLRGVAATLLWSKANDYKIHHEWDRLKATLNNIALLQPHYEKVWEFQAHNLSYNVSSEFDDYRQRYAMVREGIEYLTRGVEQNRKAPRLVWYTGWFYGQKIGMSDEKRQFRRLFADDQPQHEALRATNIAVDSPESRGPDGKPDNWLIGRQWLLYGYDLVDNGVRIRNQTPINFFQTGPKWRIKHAEAIETEGVLDDRAKSAWQLASDDWQAFGQRSVPTTSPFTIKLGGLDELLEQRDVLTKQFMELAGETYRAEEKLLYDSMNEEERTAWETPAEERDETQYTLALQLAARLKPGLGRVARIAPETVRLRAIQLATEIDDLQARYDKTTSYRGQVNYEYWQTLCAAEQEDRTVDARRLLFEAEQANADADLDLAIAKYEQAFVLWADIFDDYPVLLQDDLSEDLMRSIGRYQVAIDQETFTEDFPLAPFVAVMENETKSETEYARLRALQKAKAEPKPTEEDQPGTPEPASTPEPKSPTEPAAEPTPETPAEPTAEPKPEPAATPEPATEAEPDAGSADGAANEAESAAEVPAEPEAPPVEPAAEPE